VQKPKPKAGRNAQIQLEVFFQGGDLKTEKAWRGRRMRQALNLIDNWEEEDVADPDPTTLGGGVRRSMSNI